MRLWRLGKAKALPQVKYAAFDNTHDRETIHLYRALLRQCSYLPDSAARQFFHRHIVSRFRDYHPRNIISASGKGGRSVLVARQRQPALLKTARKGLIFLQRANDGHPRHLGKILAMTYGRIGVRRHELLKDVLIPDIPVDHAEVERLSDPAFKGLPNPSRKFQTLIKAQANRKLSFFSRANRPTENPEIPEKNAWGRPMPIKRVRNMKKRWYAETIDRIMPPLPESEWKRLRGLASGETRWEGPVQRRAPVDGKGFNTGIVRGTITGGTGFVSSPHELTPRYMRRLWTKLFAQCPLMQPNEARTLGWDIRWGNIQGSKEVGLKIGNQRSIAMFEGVDEDGKILQTV